MLQTLRQLAVGATVKIKKNGVLKDHLILHQGKPSARYDDSCDGTWVLDLTPTGLMAWDPGGSNVFETSQLADFLVWGDLYSAYEPHIQAALHSAVVPYRAGGGLNGSDRTGSSGFACTFFPLSGREVGLTEDDNPGFPRDGDKLDYFLTGLGAEANERRTFRNSGKTMSWWLRTMVQTNEIEGYYIGAYGAVSTMRVAYAQNALLYAFILDGDLWVDEDGTILPNQAPAPPASLTVPPFAEAGAALTLSWAAAADPDGDVTGYLVQRQTGVAGTWTQVYNGPALTCADTLPAGGSTVRYRVRAYDAMGLTSDFTTSASIPVYAATALTVPNMAVEGEPIAISWTAVAGAAGYTLQRKTASADWTQVCSGTAVQYTDTAGAWTSAQYRVRTLFSAGSGAWVTSQALPVLPRSTLSISGQDGGLGTLTGDVTFFATTDTGNPIDVTAAVNGLPVLQARVGSGAEQRLPVQDLPTGTGTILITAVVDADPEPVTETRTWTYSKAVPAFPASGSVARLTRNGKNLFPLTLPEAVRAPAHMGGDLGKALDTLFRLPPAVRPNLLVNPYFTASRPGGALPVNQRGAPQYSGGGAEKYTIDQWIATSDCRSLVPQSDGLSLTAIIAGQYPLYQPLDGDYSLYASRTYTVSALMGDGTLISGTGTFPASAPQSGSAVIAQSASVGAFDIKLFYNASTGQVRVGFYANSASANALILACKMEEGEGQTLGYQDGTGAWRLLPQPDDDYQTQLAKCKYFFNRYNYVQGTLMGLGIAASSSLLGIVTQIPVMRANPSIIPSSVSSIKADQANISNGISSTGISSSYMDEAGNITISLNFGGDLTPGAVYFVGLTGGYIDFSAEL